MQMARFEREQLQGNSGVDHWSTYVGTGAPRFVLSFDLQTPNTCCRAAAGSNRLKIAPVLCAGVIGSTNHKRSLLLFLRLNQRSSFLTHLVKRLCIRQKDLPDGAMDSRRSSSSISLNQARSASVLMGSIANRFRRWRHPNDRFLKVMR